MAPGLDALTDAQKAEWAQAFGDYVAASYAARFDGVQRRRVSSATPRRRRGTQNVVVTSRVILAEGPPMPIDYVVRRRRRAGGSAIFSPMARSSELAQWRRGLRGLGDSGFAASIATLRQRTESFWTP